MTEAQPSLPEIETGPVALVPGPVFVCFELKGKPAHKGRHRSRLMIPKEAWTYLPSGKRVITEEGVKKIFIMMHPDADTAASEKVLAEAGALFMRGGKPTENPIALMVHAFKEVPISWSKADRAAALAGAIRPTSRPDGDNYLKMAQDALNEIVWKDDSSVVDARVIKMYSDKPALRIEVREFVSPPR